MKNNIGKVYLVGGGPGDPGLITVKGNELLQTCDVVVYDNLIPLELIATLPVRIEKIYVGKKASQHAFPQAEINELLVKLASGGKTVVRLKGSDPLIFGRGGEEAAFMKKNNIPFEIVPGITAGVAVPAYAGIPCTDRERASMITFVTGHKAMNKESSSVQWDWLARITNGTIVLYMSVGEIESIVEQLIANGMSADRPAVVIERGTNPTQRQFSGTIKELPKLVAANNIRPPALFVIGEVIDLQPVLRWFGNRPLFGKRIMVTRPADQSASFYAELRRLGAEVLPYPTIATEEVDDESGWVGFDQLSNNDKWLIFTSENGVRYFHHLLIKRFKDIRQIAGYKIAAVGFGTARALSKINIVPDFIPSKATTRSLAEELSEKHDLSKAGIIRVRGNLADQRVEDILKKEGAEVISLLTYNTFYPTWPDNFKEHLSAYPPDAIVFSSGSTATGLYKILSSDEIQELTKGTNIVSIGPMTSEKIRSHGLTVSIEASEHSVPGIIKTLVEYYNEK